LLALPGAQQLIGVFNSESRLTDTQQKAGDKDKGSCFHGFIKLQDE
jgi:hypothetical protein